MQELYLSKKQLPFVIVIDKMETKPKKGKNMFSKLLLTSAMKIEKKSKNYLLIVLSPAKQKNQISRSLQKVSELIEN